LKNPQTEIEPVATELNARQRPLATSWQFWAGLVISLVCLGLALREVDLKGVLATLEQVNAGWLALAVLSVLATFVAKAVRWKLLFHVSNRPPVKRAFNIQAIGMLLNTFAPARLGDLARAYLMGEAEGKSKVYTLGTVVVEKFIDLFLLFLSLALLTQIALPGWLKTSPQQLGLILLVIIVVVGILIWKGNALFERARPLVKFIPATWIEWISSHTRLGLNSLDVFRQPWQLFWVIVWSVISWTLGVSTNFLVFTSLGLHLSLWVALLLFVVLQSGVALPSSPGRIGIFHYLTLITLVFFAVGKDAALGCGFILHLVVIGPIGIVGAICLWREKVTWVKMTGATAHLRDWLKRPA
jgi:glycosyltransferase 2 family protein